MKKLFAILTLCLLGTLQLEAHTYSNESIEVTDVWTRPKTESASAGGVFLTLKNIGTHDDVLISASSDIAARVELHDHIMENDVMKMREVEDIKVLISEPTKLQPGGLHVMLFGIKQSLNVGDNFTITLNFKNSKPIIVTATVKEMSHTPKKECHCHGKS